MRDEGKNAGGAEIPGTSRKGSSPLVGEASPKLAHFLPASKCFHLDQRYRPAGKAADLLDCPLFQMEQGDDQALIGAKSRQHFFQNFPRCDGLVLAEMVGRAEEMHDDRFFFLAKIAHPQLGTHPLMLQMIEAGVYGNA